MARVLSGLLLTLVLAVLVVPLCLYAGPPVLAALAREHPQRELVVPSHEEAPGVLSSGSGEFPAPAGLGAPLPDAEELAARLDAELEVSGSGEFRGAVVDALTGEVLYDLDGGAAATPASSLKVLTAAAALSVLGSDTRFETSVYAGNTPETVVLAGGGDVLLGSGEAEEDAVVGHAGLQTLAERTAAALAGREVSGTVSILVDDTLFTGEALSPAWNEEDIEVGEAAAVYPLAINSAWAVEGQQSGARVEDAALTAGEAFAAALETAAAGYGFEVDPEVTRGTAGDGADRLASVSSAPVAEQVRQMLLASDNYLAETLGRMTALAEGGEGSFDGAAAAVESAVSGLGVDTSGMVLADVSGLGSGTEITALQLARTVNAALTSADNSVRDLPYSLPVAGLSGTLASRFTDAAFTDSSAEKETPVAGLVRAKTGTLLAATSLTGFVTDADGRLLSFAFVANGLEGNTVQAREAVDAAAAALAGCGCG
ncbi:D-alanyl-D-alanine carboxypeptidase/D-alanyl-D-alanine endopeptidase [Arthrobacter gengyunqii]|uniref:D-alanyl-D-alanine carboxypeptidase/D-alanyl-D-alanine-endopeptidase n=1 Tax=Arthrobacter gengyunqii TaxID=2886940 RepID=A0ABS8GHT6_9MICC|nr:D-alanyl-D-alanine carboxypeptidase/D-alanyl-D-alanine-endopeptidase [Arthrobacter gengyunqii]MCC3266212.1 D-alanyl-D-alanine carboxypeptidase/D-alanyl-D-alanine-endopeptidase [Arthrobacter gengyunqii]